uniref:G-protein coupled receptors family 1 profile domain-containing protein n=1 Tax=Meloidogyne incognita TaxID=6306 RepID=A0A914MUC7_MELIC
MVFVVILTFGFCWLPQNFRFFLQGLNYPQASFWEHNEKILLLVQSVVQTMAYANSCVNPILYGVFCSRKMLPENRKINKNQKINKLEK